MGGCSGPELGEPSRTPAGGAAAEEIHTEKPASWRQPAEELERERERVRTYPVRAAAVNWSHFVPGCDLEELTFPRLSNLLVKVDCSTVSPLHLSWLTCRPDHRHEHA